MPPKYDRAGVQELRHRSRTPEAEAELRQIEVERVLDRVGKS